MTKHFTPRITGFAVSIGIATIAPVNRTYVGCLKYAAELRAQGHQAEVLAEMSYLGSMDIDGALLYDGSIWAENGGSRFPVKVNGWFFNQYEALEGLLSDCGVSL